MKHFWWIALWLWFVGLVLYKMINLILFCMGNNENLVGYTLQFFSLHRSALLSSILLLETNIIINMRFIKVFHQLLKALVFVPSTNEHNITGLRCLRCVFLHSIPFHCKQFNWFNWFKWTTSHVHMWTAWHFIFMRCQHTQQMMVWSFSCCVIWFVGVMTYPWLCIVIAKTCMNASMPNTRYHLACVVLHISAMGRKIRFNSRDTKSTVIFWRLKTSDHRFMIPLECEWFTNTNGSLLLNHRPLVQGGMDERMLWGCQECVWISSAWMKSWDNGIYYARHETNLHTNQQTDTHDDNDGTND